MPPNRVPSVPLSDNNNNVDPSPSPPPKEKKIVFQSPFQSLRRLRRRRARSAPPKLRRPLLEHHFRVDPARRVVLPGVPQHEDDWYRDTHDFFNLIVLIPIVALDVMNWNWEKLFHLKKKETLADAWTGEWFHIFFACTATYFVVDLLWILLVPKCVKSPSTIIQHHIATLIYILMPYFKPELRYFMGACMSVELNTWCLIARRVFNKAGFPPWIIDLSFVSIRIKMISILFYVSWIGIRCILYPVLMVWIVNRYLSQSDKLGTYLHIELVNPVLHSTFCILNFKWTYDLLMSKIRYYKKRSHYPKGGYVDKGL